MSHTAEATVYYHDRKEPFVHSAYYRLSDTSASVLEKFLSECDTHLSHHPGQTDFSMGLRALQVRNETNELDFDVAVRMVFKNFQFYEKFSQSKKPGDFVTAVAGMISRSKIHNYFIYS